MTRYPVNEIFFTVQGEGVLAGTPAVFVRLQGCPVGCAFCDTKHTWKTSESDRAFSIDAVLNKTHEASSTWAYFSAQQVAQAAKAISKPATKLVVITGGEPALYPLNELCSALNNAQFKVQIETSGTHKVDIKDNSANVWITVSPKINMPGGFAVLDQPVSIANELKFVLGSVRDERVVLDFIRERGWQGDVMIQPMSAKPAATRRAIAFVQEHGFHLSVQTHKYIGIR